MSPPEVKIIPVIATFDLCRKIKLEKVIMCKQVKVIIIGCGCRGISYSRFAERFPERMKIVAVAEPRDYYRNYVADLHNIPEEYRFRTWEDALAIPKFADAVLICTQDALHEAPAIRSAELGYHILLEKPMAPTEDACRRIVKAVKDAGVYFAVCHVLRYTACTRKIKELIKSGAIGDIVTIQRLEGVAHWHQAHAFVRGNWRNEKESSFMLLAKSCHDMDWIRYVMDKPCTEVQSFGSLYHFNEKKQPEGAADRCMDCPTAVETLCPYSAVKIYLRDKALKGNFDWPVDILTSDLTVNGVMKALQTGPYGRCVYKCDNDVVDNQTVNMKFADGSTAVFTMTAFCNDGRQTRICGTKGSIYTDEQKIILTDFLTGVQTDYDTNIINDNGVLSGHGGGDSGIMDTFLSAISNGQPELILTGFDDTLEGHLIAFKAEESRHTGKVINLN